MNRFINWNMWLFISYIYVSAALLWATYANPLPDEPNAGDVYRREDTNHARSGDIISELDLVAARAELDAEDAEGLEIRGGGDGSQGGGGCIVV
ncbi:hypothetical protein C8R45DRAFT_1115444 [Mycena sanguinolenta]|nr:hypothetical protein C8R45DRAFT_1115444 [Mycena sanguinolenta]